jgi:hypothetical protein
MGLKHLVEPVVQIMEEAVVLMKPNSTQMIKQYGIFIVNKNKNVMRKL